MPSLPVRPGYGVFADHPGPCRTRSAPRLPPHAVLRRGGVAAYYVIYGPTPKDVLRRYTAPTGRPARVPDWSYGLWLRRRSPRPTTRRPGTSLRGWQATRHPAVRLPLRPPDARVPLERRLGPRDPSRIPRGCSRGSRPRACGSACGSTSSRACMFAEGRARLPARSRRGPSGDGPVAGGMGLVDFTNPDAVRLAAPTARARCWARASRLLRDGLRRADPDGCRGTTAPTRSGCTTAAGCTRLYRCGLGPAGGEARGRGRCSVRARRRSAARQFPRTGAATRSRRSRRWRDAARRLSLALSGFGYWSHDIGGFEGTPDPRCSSGGLRSLQVVAQPPARLDPTGCCGRSTTRLSTWPATSRGLLAPHAGLAQAGVEAHEQGVPVMRLMVLEFPDDRGARTVDTQYMLGSDLLVAPVFWRTARSTCTCPTARGRRCCRASNTGSAVGARAARVRLAAVCTSGSVKLLAARDERPGRRLAGRPDAARLRAARRSPVGSRVSRPRAATPKLEAGRQGGDYRCASRRHVGAVVGAGRAVGGRPGRGGARRRRPGGRRSAVRGARRGRPVPAGRPPTSPQVAPTTDLTGQVECRRGVAGAVPGRVSHAPGHLRRPEASHPGTLFVPAPPSEPEPLEGHPMTTTRPPAASSPTTSLGVGDRLVPDRGRARRGRPRPVHRGTPSPHPARSQRATPAARRATTTTASRRMSRSCRASARRPTGSSIAWPRIQLTGSGEFNQAGLDFYSTSSTAFIAAGIKPVDALPLGTLPQPLEDEGGWANRETALLVRGLRPASLAEVLGDRIHLWTTLNEPWCSAFSGYVGRARPRRDRRQAASPGRRPPPQPPHGLAGRAIREVLGEDAPISITLNLHVMRRDRLGRRRRGQAPHRRSRTRSSSARSSTASTPRRCSRTPRTSPTGPSCRKATSVSSASR